jgi:hypothetical protein
MLRVVNAQDDPRSAVEGSGKRKEVEAQKLSASREVPRSASAAGMKPTNLALGDFDLDEVAGGPTRLVAFVTRHRHADRVTSYHDGICAGLEGPQPPPHLAVDENDMPSEQILEDGSAGDADSSLVGHFAMLADAKNPRIADYAPLRCRCFAATPTRDEICTLANVEVAIEAITGQPNLIARKAFSFELRWRSVGRRNLTPRRELQVRSALRSWPFRQSPTPHKARRRWSNRHVRPGWKQHHRGLTQPGCRRP